MFDAYREWLGIPAGEQPPNHYRLLGIPVFEESGTVIENAADQRMGHLRTFQSGAHSAESQRLLGEVAAARVCLLNPQEKALYDQALRQRIQPGSGPAESSEAFFLDPELATLLTTRKTSTAAGASAGRRKRSRSNPTMLIAVAALTVTAVGLLVLWLATGNSDAPSDQRMAKAADSAAPARPVQEAAPKPPSAAKREIPLAAPTANEEEAKADHLIAAPVAKPSAPQPAAPAPAQGDEDVSGDAKPVAGDSPLVKPAATEENAAKKQDPPSASEQKRLMGEIDEVYKPGDAKDPAAKAALARKLLEDGRKNEANRSEQFVMFRRAAEIARDAGQADLMLEAADAIAAAGFDVRPIPMKSRLLKRLVEQGAAGDPSRLAAASACCIRFAEEAAASGAFDEAAELVEAARKSLAKANLQAQADLRMAKAAAARIREPAERAKKAELERKADEAQADVDAIRSAHAALAACGKGIEQSRREREAIQAAQKRLKTAPDDPEACLAVGRWRCFEQGDWTEGLKLLAKGSDASLKGLAEEDLASKPATAEERVARGDAWWNAAEKAAGKSKIALRKRAGQWYQEALPDLPPGLGKSRVEKRLSQVADEPPPQGEGRPIGPPPPPAIAPFNEKTARQHQARWAKYLGVPVVQSNSIGMKLVLIPPGEFTMGAADLETAPQHHVRITKPFYLGENLVTQEQWEAEMGSNPSHFQGAKNPVETVGWDDCMVFLGKLNAKTGRQKGKFVLPTEAQWEYACRAGSTSHYCFGDNESGLGDYAWYEANSNRTTHPVGEKKPNAWGLYDMHGNVSQWCQDWYDAGYYLHSPADDPRGPDTGSNRVGRGGCWFGPASVCCSDGRAKGSPEFRGNGLGLRVCLVPAE